MVQAVAAVQVQLMVNADAKAAYRMFLTDQSFRRWLSDGAYVQPRDGGRLFLTWDSGFAVIGTYETREQDKQVAFTWQVVGEPDITHVCATFDSVDGGTRVTVTHDGASTGPNGRDPQAGWTVALEVLQSVLEEGDDIRFTRRPMLGIMVGDMNEAAATRLGLEKPEGILIDGTLPEMGAGKAGLGKDDVIVGLDGRPTPDFLSFGAVVGEHKAGDTVELEYIRAGQRHTVPLTFSRRELPEVPATPAGFADALERLYAQTNAELDEVLKGITEQEASRRPAEGEWSVLEILAHLVLEVDFNDFWLTTLIASDEVISNFSNVQARIDGYLAAYPTLAEMRDAFLRAQRQIVGYVRNLPDDFATHKPEYVRFGQLILQAPFHPRQHFDQIRAALAAARA